MDKLEAIKNELRKMAKACDLYGACKGCPYIDKCYENLGATAPMNYLTRLERCENLLNN